MLGAQKKRAEWLALSRLRYLTNLTNSRVRSTHPFHTKSPFSRFGGGRRQKSENIVVSARGRRRPQAPTLRTLGCAIAREYDYKSSALYSRSKLCCSHRSPRRRTNPNPKVRKSGAVAKAALASMVLEEGTIRGGGEEGSVRWLQNAARTRFAVRMTAVGRGCCEGCG